ncbi:MAG: hypothetical protein RLZZ241_829 [Bacteroidota bacterium]|jgi:LAO/AO transport system kinase
MVRHPLEIQSLLDGILSGNRAILARSITLIESTKPTDQPLASTLVEACLTHAGKSIRIGITGVPGAGKSTFIEQFGLLLIAQGYRVAVLAVDPSSSVSKGSILGDKTRMEKLSQSQDAFIRPSPSGLTLGGVARTTRESILLCEAAGYSIILVETVGVGQNEITVYDLVDFFLLLQLTGAGDDLQGMKRGILEMADVIAINKADGENLPKALNEQKSLETTLHFYAAKPGGWKPQVTLCSALEGTGIAEIWNIIQDFQKQMSDNASFYEKRKNQNLKWFKQHLDHGLIQYFRQKPKFQRLYTEMETGVRTGKISPFRAASELITTLGISN